MIRYERGSPDAGDIAQNLVADAGSFLLIVANAALLVFAAAAVREAWHDELSVEGRLTLLGFVGVEALMVLLGAVDHLLVRKAVRTELDDAGVERPRPSVGKRVARALVGRRPRKADDGHVQRLDGLQPAAPNPQPAVDAGNSESPRADAGLANRDRDDRRPTSQRTPEVAGAERRRRGLAAAAAPATIHAR